MGVNTTTGVTVGASGISVSFDGIVFDPSTNSGGAAARGVDFATTAAPYSVTFNNCTLQGWTTYGHYAPSGNLNAHITWNNQAVSGGTVQSAFYLPSIVSGCVLAFNGLNVTITNKSSLGFGVVDLKGASSPPPSVYFVDPTIDCTLDGSQTSAGIDYLIRITDMVMRGSGGTFTSSAPAGSREIHTIACSQSTYGIDGSTWNTATIVDNGNGGIGFLMGQDGATDRTLANRCTITGIIVSGNAAVEPPSSARFPSVRVASRA